MSGPAKNLKCVDYKWRSHENDVVQVYFFDDGSVWNKWQGEWNVEWQPEPTAAAPAATPERPKTITVDELRVGDEVHLFGELRRIEFIGPTGRYSISGVKTVSMKCDLVEFLARGVQVYRDDKLISGWPVESLPDNFNWRDLYKSAEADVKKHEARIAELEAELAALKAKQQEETPLDPWRVLMTAHRFCGDQSCEIQFQASKAFWGLLGTYIWNACEIEGKTGVIPYSIK